MTVFDYLKFMGDLRHLPKVEDRVDEVLGIVNMADRANGYISNLSKGMRQRIGLAQALLHKPDVLILDEPTIGLDPAQIIEVRNLIRELGKEHTILLSTHILSEAQQICNRVLIINKGRIVAEDSPERLQARTAGAQKVILRVGGDAYDVPTLVGALPGVVQVSSLADGSLEFDVTPGQDIRPAVARAVVNAGYDLLELRPVGVSLEDIFMQLTRDEPTPPQVSENALDEEIEVAEADEEISDIEPESER
jgi:ABC-2 type transport system ATP-binding protein